MIHGKWRQALGIGCGLMLQFPHFLVAQPTDKAKDAGSALHLAVSVQGPVTIKRQGWSGQAPVVFGTYLRIGDLLHLEDFSLVKVVCSDLSLHDLRPGIAGVPCIGAQPVMHRRDGSLINPTRGGEGRGSQLLVVSPRKTKVLSPHPLLRWTAVEGASRYRVTVRGPNLTWTSQVDDVTRLEYPAWAPDLKTGVDYKLIVEVDGKSSATEPGLGLGFSLVGAEERKGVAREEKKVEELGLSAGATQFLVAHLYAGHGLNAEAIQRLEDISGSFKVSAVARVLAELYLSLGLTRHAEAAYLNLLNLSREEGDRESGMLAHVSLARIYGVLGNKKLILEHLDAALFSANEIGDQQTAGQAKRMMAEMR